MTPQVVAALRIAHAAVLRREQAFEAHMRAEADQDATSIDRIALSSACTQAECDERNAWATVGRMVSDHTVAGLSDAAFDVFAGGGSDLDYYLASLPAKAWESTLARLSHGGAL